MRNAEPAAGSFGSRLSHRTVALLALVNLALAVAYTGSDYAGRRSLALDHLDATLLAHARGVDFSVAAWHDAEAARPSSEEDYVAFLRRLSTYAKAAGVAFVYTTVLDGDRVAFMSSSDEPEEFDKGTYTKRGDPYPDASPALRRALEKVELGYDTYTDQWGTFRSVFLPSRTPGGRVFAVGVDVSTADVESVLRKALWSALLLGVMAFLLGFSVSLLLARAMERSVQAVTSESERITAAIERGELSVRGDPAALPREFAPVVHGMNRMVEAFVVPLRGVAEGLDRISRGEAPPPATGSTQGELAAMEEALQRSAAAVGRLVHDVERLCEAAAAGELSLRAEPAVHQGEFRRAVEGVNAMLGAVVEPMHAASGALAKLAARDLSARCEGDFRGEHAALSEAVNATAGALQGALGRVAEAAEQLSTASAQIASSSQAVAGGASLQASSLQKTGSSLEAMSAVTRRSAEAARQADALARSANGAASDGQTAMEEMATAMTRIRAAAEGTSQIIRDINEIAFQTNLLALNAAVEQRGRARPGAASRWWGRRSARWRSARSRPPTGPRGSSGSR